MTSARDKLLTAVRRLAGEAGRDLPSDLATDVSPLQLAGQLGLDQETVAGALAEVLGIACLHDLSESPASAEFLERIPISFARQHGLLGLASTNGRMRVAMAGIASLDVLGVLARHLGKPIEPLMATPAAVASAINAAYQQQTGQAQTFIDRLDRQGVLAELDQLERREDLLDNSSRAPVIKLVNLLLFEAVQQLASDVHVQPGEDRLTARLRIDGVLFDAFDLPKALQEEIVSRIKVLGRMNIAEKRLAQDGRATVQVGDRVIDLRISTLPTSFGERAVIRLLDKSARLYSLSELGMNPTTLQLFRQIISLEHGLILVTGPTGSGKTTTLYAALQEIDRKQNNILTLEDPIEYQLEGISQTQVSDKKGMTFASGLRYVLRQDPDIIMVGEIRDHETAAMAIQSALTGHLVFSTLHTNDAASAVTRLLDLGIEPYLVASSVIGVMAQRLVRHLCPDCAQPASLSPEELHQLQLDPATPVHDGFLTACGCTSCRDTGYRGRVGLFELMVVEESVRRQIQTTATASDIKAAAVRQGMMTLRDDGLGKIAAGVTTVQEVLRVVMRATI